MDTRKKTITCLSSGRENDQAEQEVRVKKIQVFQMTVNIILANSVTWLLKNPTQFKARLAMV